MTRIVEQQHPGEPAGLWRVGSAAGVTVPNFGQATGFDFGTH